VHAYAARDRLARIAAIFTFVGHLVDVPPPEDDPRDGVDVLVSLAGEQEGPAVILSALLQALGEKVTLDYGAGQVFVRVALEAEDLSRLPPHAGPIEFQGRYYLPLDPRQARAPLGFLPRSARPW
jgi:hypothetical protein